MKIAVIGFEGPVAQAVRAEAERRGHAVSKNGAECAIYLPGTVEELENVVSRGGFRRLVLRSHAFAYGSSTKNPGFLSEDRLSLLPATAPEQRWLRAEAAAARHPNWAAVRLTNVLAAEEGDLLVRQLSRRAAMPLAGHDPNVQFISIGDAARALLAAAESPATGLFNAAGDGAIPLKKAFRAAGTRRIPIPKPLVFGRDASVEQLQYNWTVSGERAARELGFRPERSTVEALADFLADKPGARPDLLLPRYDDWGLDEDYIQAWNGWFTLVRTVYWRIESEGLENIPAAGRALFVANHRGFVPIDAVMHLYLHRTFRRRIPRFLIINSLLRFPFLCNFLTKLGGVIANQENAARLFAAEELVGIFPEGIRGTFQPYKMTYKLRDFSKSSFAQIAVENQAPIIPAAVIGHSEIFPIIGRIDSAYVRREFGWPYLPIAPPFPLAPIPIPSKWHVRVLDPVPVAGLKPADAQNDRLMKEFARHVQAIMQRNIDDMLSRRKHIFSGRVLNGDAPAAPVFEPSRGASRPARMPVAVAADRTTASHAATNL